MSARRNGLRWGSPHLDAVGTGLLVLSCSTSLYDDAGRFLGVAGLDLTLSLLKKGLLAIPEAPAVMETFLLDEDGRILVRSRIDRVSAKPGEALSLEPFAHRAVVDELKTGSRGHLELPGTNPPLLAVFQRFKPIHLSFVALVDRDRLLAP
jgi:hypothetical protein